MQLGAPLVSYQPAYKQYQTPLPAPLLPSPLSDYCNPLFSYCLACAGVKSFLLGPTAYHLHSEELGLKDSLLLRVWRMKDIPHPRHPLQSPPGLIQRWNVIRSILPVYYKYSSSHSNIISPFSLLSCSQGIFVRVMFSIFARPECIYISDLCHLKVCSFLVPKNGISFLY